MKSIVLYSSRTGNTKMVAEAIASALPKGTPCLDIQKLQEPLDAYDCVFMGYWVDKGTADAASQKVLAQLHNPHVALFATLGANPKGEHAMKCLENGAALLPPGQNRKPASSARGKWTPSSLKPCTSAFRRKASTAEILPARPGIRLPPPIRTPRI